MSKYIWEIVAKDYNAPFCKNYIFTRGFLGYPEHISIPTLLCGAVSRQDQIDYIYVPKNWAECHEALKARIVKNPELLNYIIDKTNSVGESINSWTEKNIYISDLTKLSHKKIVRLFEEFFRRQALLYTYGTSVALLDFHNYSFVEGNLKKIIEQKVAKKDFQKYYRLLTTPLKNSFSQDQEEAILILMQKYYHHTNWRRDVERMTLGELKLRYRQFYKDLKRHTEKFAWVYFVYKGPAFTTEQFLEFIRDYLIKKVNPSRYLGELKQSQKQIINERQKVLKKLSLDKFESLIAYYAPKVVWSKPRRKDYQSKSYYHFEKLLTEISNRLSISINQARAFTPDSLRLAFLRNKIDQNVLNDTYKLHVCIPENGRVRVLIGKSAEEFVKKMRKTKIKELTASSLTGSPAYSGKAVGRVKQIYQPTDMHKMQRGDILISNATTPSIIQAMKLSSAIVTDEGGLTCHAAIVSRELRIPCIVGTKFATQVFKDGDMVEVDANKGIVRKI